MDALRKGLFSMTMSTRPREPAGNVQKPCLVIGRDWDQETRPGDEDLFKIKIDNPPTEETDEDTKQTFYDTIEESMNNLACFDMKIIIGDFNAKIDKEERNYEIAGKESLHRKTNKNGQRLIDLAAGNRMII
ncbi:hypothetical protein ILUMI_07709 [Ignelater luminosus]|uniref:Uncharacterized protein n=1 Tax=Ignelater luminosus TaxID=2038154 RepID=A0A8K0D6Y9_IGNLU|nr:hypothetical protein ILUMI_07709 [Ignelater luminosus]